MLDPIGMHYHPTQWRNVIRRASRDVVLTNIKLSPSGMYPQGFHPVQLNRSKDFKGRAKSYTRTQRPTRYYLIDFGLSHRYNSRNVSDQPLPGGDNTAPEQQFARPCNPFRTDIYDFWERHSGTIPEGKCLGISQSGGLYGPPGVQRL
jgi:hypothetical protein